MTAVCTIGTNAAVVAAELMYQGKMLTADEIRCVCVCVCVCVCARVCTCV